jgi:hypothetical protein
MRGLGLRWQRKERHKGSGLPTTHSASWDAKMMSSLIKLPADLHVCILARNPSTAASTQFRLLCCQPELIPESLAARVS